MNKIRLFKDRDEALSFFETKSNEVDPNVEIKVVENGYVVFYD